MGDSRPASPEEPPQDLWSSILNSVSSSRSIPCKQVVILGESSSGKSTIAAGLLQKPVADENDDHRDFAIGYDWADVRDEADEDTLARVSVYTVPTSSHAHLALLPHFVPPRTALPHTAFIVVLDWTKPWTFVEQLLLWLAWIETWAGGDGSRELELMREENRERLQSFIQRYSEPSAEALPTTSTVNDTLLPLGPGTFTHNASGVPIIVVCSRADLIDDMKDPIVGGTAGMGGMVKGKGSEWEEQTDGIMQVLRVICLKYGASLFYTTHAPQTLQVLRQYALHILFLPPAPSPGSTSAETTAPYRSPFPFSEKTNILDRDHILVPSGWDSWGKIAVLRDGFEAKSWGEAWDRDLDALAGSDEVQDENEKSIKTLYAELVPDQSVKPHPLPPFNEPMPEQTFLAKHYDENAKRGDNNPRASARIPGDIPGQLNTGVVGPMGGGFLPNVERALSEMEGGLLPGTDRKATRRDGPRTSTGLANGLSQSTGRGLGSSTSSSPPAGQTQNEVLANFFQSLLSQRDRTATPVPPRTGASPTNGQGGGEAVEAAGSGSGTE